MENLTQIEMDKKIEMMKKEKEKLEKEMLEIKRDIERIKLIDREREKEREKERERERAERKEILNRLLIETDPEKKEILKLALKLYGGNLKGKNFA
jgi:septal ring factor EnvC (AmiA/AmiB activator)